MSDYISRADAIRAVLGLIVVFLFWRLSAEGGSTKHSESRLSVVYSGLYETIYRDNETGRTVFKHCGSWSLCNARPRRGTIYKL